MSISSENLRLKNGVDSLLSEAGSFLADLLEAPQGDEEEAHLVIDAQLQHFWKSYYKLKARHDENALSVAVLALTKSGKSTLLNALISSECLPVNNVPETARICKIVHDNTGNREPVLKDGSKSFKGDKLVRERLQSLNSEVRSREHQVADEQLLNIHAPLTALQQYDTAEFGKMFLLDTPGPNEAGEEQLRYQVERLLDGVDAVVYVLDYTKLKTAEEADCFKRLKRINPQLISRLSQRLFFVVNKVDAADTSEGLDADETREYVADLVTRQLEGEGFRLMPEQVLLLSARNALLSRLVLAGKASPDVLRRFSRLAFGSFQAAGPKNSAPTADQFSAAANAMLADSGILELEARVLTFLAAHSTSVKLLATVDDIVRLLQAVRNVAVSCRACLRLKVEELQLQTGTLRGQLQETLDCFDEVSRDTDVIQADVVHEITSHLSSLRGRLFTQIIQTLDAEMGTGRTAPSNSSASATGRWQRVREKFLSIFTTSAAVGGVPAARSRSREELAKLLGELHEDLLAQIQTEVADFWHVLEACTAGRHGDLVARLNGHLAALARRVEGAVAQQLQVDLVPADLSLSLPGAQQFHSDLQQLLNKGISETQEKHIRVGTRRTEERVMRFHNGLCKWGAYWVDEPRTRTVVETYNVTVYQLQPHEITGHFIQMVDGAVEASEKALSGYVAAFMRQQLQAAREQIDQYSDRYLGAMTSALEASHRGADHRSAALAQVEAYLGRLDLLSAAAEQLQADAERHVPQLQDAIPYEEVDGEETIAAMFAEEAAAAAAAAGGSAPAAAPAAGLPEAVVAEVVEDVATVAKGEEDSSLGLPLPAESDLESEAESMLDLVDGRDDLEAAPARPRLPIALQRLIVAANGKPSSPVLQSDAELPCTVDPASAVDEDCLPPLVDDADEPTKHAADSMPDLVHESTFDSEGEGEPMTMARLPVMPHWAGSELPAVRTLDKDGVSGNLPDLMDSADFSNFLDQAEGAAPSIAAAVAPPVEDDAESEVPDLADSEDDVADDLAMAVYPAPPSAAAPDAIAMLVSCSSGSSSYQDVASAVQDEEAKLAPTAAEVVTPFATEAVAVPAVDEEAEVAEVVAEDPMVAALRAELDLDSEEEAALNADLLPVPDYTGQPFDYRTGFFRAMSTSGMAGAAAEADVKSPRSHSSEDWQMVGEDVAEEAAAAVAGAAAASSADLAWSVAAGGHF